MKQLQTIFICVFIATTIISCKQKSEADDAAAVICDCAGPMVDLMNKMMSNPGDMMSMQGEMEKIQKDMETCIGTRLDKYKDRDADTIFQKDIEEAVKASCPDIYKGLYGESPNQ